MKKTSSILLASMLILGGISVAGPAMADAGGTPHSDNGVGHTPVYLCHEGKVISPDDSSLNAHLGHGDIQLPSEPAPEKGSPCGAEPSTSATPSPTVSETSTATATATPEPSSTATATPSEPIVEPTETSEPVPTATETEGPHATFPTEPSVIFPDRGCGMVNGQVILPEIIGVAYRMYDAHMGKVMVEATPEEGYFFEGKGGSVIDQKIEWEVTVVKNFTCPTDAPWAGETNAPVSPEKHVTHPTNQNRGLNVQTAVTAPVKAATVPANQLAYTGADKTGWALVGGAMLLLGVLLLALPKLARRKH